MVHFNLYLCGYWFNQTNDFEPTIQEVLDLFYDGIHNYPADWISPEFITMQPVEVL